MTDLTTDTIDPSFRAHLAWEVSRAARREHSLGLQPPARRSRTPWLVAVACVAIALGVGSNLAVAQVRDGARRDSLSEAIRAELQVLDLRRQVAESTLTAIRRQQQAGLASSASVDDAQAQLNALTTRLQRSRLNLDEVHRSAQAPRDDLTAPLVDGHDFVRERTDLDVALAQSKVALAERMAEEVDRRVRAGVVSEIAKAEAAADLAQVQSDLTVALKRGELRQEYRDRHTPADSLVHRLDQLQRSEDLAVAMQQLTVARERAALAQKQHAIGTASEVELMRAQLDLKERELAITQLRAQLRRLGEMRRDSL